MRKLLIPLLAAIALPTAVNAESVWLILLYGKSFDQNGSVAASLEKIEMKNIDDCKDEGSRWLSSQTIKKTSDRGYHCVIGK